MLPIDRITSPGVPSAADISRRGLLITTLTAALLAACRDTQEQSTSPSAPSTRTLTDHAGRSVTLRGSPRRIVGTSTWVSTAPMLWLKAPVVGMPALTEGFQADFFTKHFDLAGITSIGLESSPDVEQIAALRPDVIVAGAYDGQLNLAQGLELQRLEMIAPVVGVAGLQPVEEVMQLLTEVIGDGITQTISVQKAEFDRAHEQLRAQLGPRWQDVTVSAFSVTRGQYFVRRPTGSIFADIFNRLGVSWTELSRTSDTQLLQVSPERIAELNADLIVYPVGGAYAVPGDFPGQQLFDQLPAVRAKQVIELDLDSIQGSSYPGYASVTRQVLAQLERIPGFRADIV